MPRSHGATSQEASGTVYANGRPRPSRTWRIWEAMRRRCYDKKHRAYPDYGGRGICVFWEWLGENGFANFVRDMGECPEGHVLDRIDPEEGYSPWNCRWLTLSENCARVRRDEHHGVVRTAVGPDGIERTLTLGAWAELLGVKYRTLSRRLQRGWGDRAFREGNKHG